MKEIKLTQGKVALVDDEDFEYLNQFKWCAVISKNTFYAIRSGSKKRGEEPRTNIKMHRAILKLTNPKNICDHKDNNGLNNQKSNLRIATPLQNQMNSTPRKNAISKYKGVTFKKSKNRWEARIMLNGKNINIGTFKDEIECAKAYDKKAKELFKEFAYINFKD